MLARTVSGLDCATGVFAKTCSRWSPRVGSCASRRATSGQAVTITRNTATTAARVRMKTRTCTGELRGKPRSRHCRSARQASWALASGPPAALVTTPYGSGPIRTGDPRPPTSVSEQYAQILNRCAGDDKPPFPTFPAHRHLRPSLLRARSSVEIGFSLRPAFLSADAHDSQGANDPAKRLFFRHRLRLHWWLFQADGQTDPQQRECAEERHEAPLHRGARQ